MPANNRKRGTCSFPGCPNPHHSMGLCQSHRHQQRRGVELHPLLPARGGRTKLPVLPCSIEGCTQPSKARGWCGAHYSQWRRGMEPHPIGIRTPKGPKPPARVPVTGCAFPGCDRPHLAKGWCKAHWMQQRTGRPMFPIGERPKRAGATPRPKLTPKPAKVGNLPDGWDRVSKPKRRAGGDKSSMRLEIGPVRELADDEITKARHTVELMTWALGIPASEALEALGLVAA